MGTNKLKTLKKMYHEESLEKYSFLVTGGAGFIGSNIVAYLIEHHAKKIRILDNLSTGFLKNIEPFLSLPNVEFIQESIVSTEVCMQACQGIDYVLHQAALGSVPRSLINPIASNEANVTGFLNILWACKERGVKRLVYASSSSVYGDSPILPKQENQIGKPLSPYALTKYINELYAEVFAKNYGMDCIGLRYFNVFGYNQSPEGAYAAVIPLFINALMKKQAPAIHGYGEQSRDFTFVENAVQANIRAALSKHPQAGNKVYNIACGEQLSINEIFRIIKEIMEVEISPIYTTARKGDIRNSLADISAAKEFLGYQPTILAKEGLRKTIEWFMEER
ncbi:MAG: SDR family oxidoreductase [Raineya sp.]